MKYFTLALFLVSSFAMSAQCDIDSKDLTVKLLETNKVTVYHNKMINALEMAAPDLKEAGTEKLIFKVETDKSGKITYAEYLQDSSKKIDRQLAKSILKKIYGQVKFTFPEASAKATCFKLALNE